MGRRLRHDVILHVGDTLSWTKVIRKRIYRRFGAIAGTLGAEARVLYFFVASTLSVSNSIVRDRIQGRRSTQVRVEDYWVLGGRAPRGAYGRKAVATETPLGSQTLLVASTLYVSSHLGRT